VQQRREPALHPGGGRLALRDEGDPDAREPQDAVGVGAGGSGERPEVRDDGVEGGEPRLVGRGTPAHRRGPVGEHHGAADPALGDGARQRRREHAPAGRHAAHGASGPRAGDVDEALAVADRAHLDHGELLGAEGKHAGCDRLDAPGGEDPELVADRLEPPIRRFGEVRRDRDRGRSTGVRWRAG